MVLFLGDLVAKGPSSAEVVRLAIDIGALSVRGNHDHEVVRQGITFRRRLGVYKDAKARANGLERNEHLQIALELSRNEFQWLCNLPYYIKCRDLGTLFVHAGFQNGKRFEEQNPWAMMSMRSVLPDGRVTTRCFNKYSWADKWKGPHTILFGHDAARGKLIVIIPNILNILDIKY